MSVLSVAQKTASTSRPSGDDEPQESSDTGQSDAPGVERSIDVADRLTTSIEEFLTGLTFGTVRPKIDWDALSPFLSALGSITTILTAFGLSGVVV